ncbi:MAG: ubiquinol-cytochrome c reductase iron-sulfur subunit [Alphaproteobacteria bacterium]
MSDTVQDDHTEGRRDFLSILALATAGVGAAAFVWPVIDSMNPSADVLALASTEVDLSQLEVGQSITVLWRKKPVFIRRRTESEINAAQAVDLDDLIDPQSDADRVQNPEFLIMVGVCTHLGCIPLGQKSGDPKGEFGGWFCPCHGSHYDTSGRIRKGPAPSNLLVPGYEFLTDTTVRIG